MTAASVAAALLTLWAAADPFGLLAPLVLTPADHRALERGDVVSRTFDAPSGKLGIFAVSRIDVPADALLAGARRIEDLKRSPFVIGIKRFSNPPRLEDVDSLVLPPKELRAAASCRPGSCSLKLSPDEIQRLQDAAAGQGSDDRVLRAFRRIVLDRASAYLAGNIELPPLADRPSGSVAESFLYWSQEIYGAGKPVVLITHLNIFSPVAPDDPAIVIGKTIFATHYITGGLAVTAITTDAATGARFLIYRNSTSVDLLSGFLGPLRRAVLESRLKRDVPDIIHKLRTRLERSERTVR